MSNKSPERFIPKMTDNRRDRDDVNGQQKGGAMIKEEEERKGNGSNAG